jgi:isoprenylcysteine carboxyl methyltransferase (ICMT) family protein YpbQ
LLFLKKGLFIQELRSDSRDQMSVSISNSKHQVTHKGADLYGFMRFHFLLFGHKRFSMAIQISASSSVTMNPDVMWQLRATFSWFIFRVKLLCRLALQVALQLL